MTDSKIVELFCNRDENALVQVAEKYDRYCQKISYNILGDWEDVKECVNDTYWAAWKSIPPHLPTVLSTYLGKLTRRISINRWRSATSKKRGGGEICLALEEVQDIISDEMNVEKMIERKELTHIINRFLEKLPETERDVFVCRYWYFTSIREISDKFGYHESKTKSMLFRTRKSLLKCLQKEGVL